MYVLSQHTCKVGSLSVYLNITGLRPSPGKTFWGFWKVLEFFVSNWVGTLSISRATDDVDRWWWWQCCHWPYVIHRWHWLTFVCTWRPCYSVQFVKHCSTVGASMMPNATVTVAQTQIYLLDIVNASFYSESQWWSVHGHGCVRLQRGLLKR